MKYYVDDVFFATTPIEFDINQFFEDWPSVDCRKRFELNDFLYVIQEHKKQDEIREQLIPSQYRKIVPEIVDFNSPLLYAIVRESITDSPYDFDYISKDDRDFLLNFLYFTALIHPTPIDLAYSARVLYKDEERTELDRVLPNTSLGNCSQFLIDPKGSYRNYLTPDELRESYSLYKLYKSNENNKTLRPANLNLLINYYLSSFWTIYFEISLITAVSALEAIVTSSKHNISQQFRERVSRVSDELQKIGLIQESITEPEVKQMYNLRCEYTHRGKFNKDWNEYKDNYKYLKSAREVLAAIIRKCIEDTAFAEIFDDKEKVKYKWPVLL